VELAAKKSATAARHTRAASNADKARALFAAHRDALAALPHPDSRFAKRTLADKVAWYLDHAGDVRKYKEVIAALKTAGINA
jgi:hypothetical protein